MKVAVTGGTGCLGRPLLHKLLRRRLDIRLLALPGDKGVQEFSGRAEAITGSLHSKEALERLVHNCEVVFHLAGRVHTFPGTKLNEDEFFQTNVVGTENLLQACKGSNVKRIIFYSTVGVYGRDADFHGDESSTCEPVSVYQNSKRQAENLIIEGAKTLGPQGVILRLPVAYGPLDRGNIARLIRAVSQKRFFYFGEGNAVRSMISSENAAEAALKAAFEPQAANKVFCITDGRDYSMRELVETICGALGIGWRPSRFPVTLATAMGRLGDFLQRYVWTEVPVNSETARKLTRPLTFSCQKAKQELGYVPMETLQEGIAKEVVWLKQSAAWK